MGMIIGGHGGGSHIGGSGMMMPSADADAGKSKVESRMTKKLMVNKTDLGFIISS
jgi:hypothetical protein